MVITKSSLTSGSVSNDFTINVGTSGNTNFSLSTEFPAGSYICTSSLSDSTLDIYLIASDGSSAGYASASTSSTTVVASKKFNRVVIYGGANNDTLSFQFKYVFSGTNVTSNTVGAPPYLRTTNTQYMAATDNTVTVTGDNFASDISFTFTGTDNIARSAKSVSRTNDTTAIVTRPDTLPEDYAPYTITATNPTFGQSPTSSNFHKLSNRIFTAPMAPTSVSSSDNFNGSVSVSFTAGSNNGGTAVTSYTVTSSPGGITASGASSPITLSGLTPGTSYTFTVTATNAAGTSVASSASSARVPFIASGGTITTNGGYRYHSFGSNGTFSAAGNKTIQVLLGAGGGGNGTGSWNGTAGAGGVFQQSFNLNNSTTQNYSIVIGAAGSNGTPASNGSNTTFTGLSAAIGGGRAAVYNPDSAAGSGGSGGGGAHSNPSVAQAGGSGTSGQGNSGNGAYYNGNGPAAGGAGGAGGGGGTGPRSSSEPNTMGGNSSSGGNGTSAYSIWGEVSGFGSYVNGSTYSPVQTTGYYFGAGNGGYSYQSSAGLNGLGSGSRASANQSGFAIVRYAI